MAKAKAKAKKTKRTAAQKRATAKMIAANKAAKRAGLAKRASAPASGIGARVARLEGQVADLRTDVDAHTSLFRHIADNSRGLFAGSGSSARQLGAGR